MPAIVIKDYTWRQTDDAVIIYVPLVGHPKNVDLFTMDNYIKASYPPFILELFLWGRILDLESECTLSREQAVFSLKKADQGLVWPGLVTESLDKQAQREQRNHALERAQLMAQDRAKIKSEQRHKLQKQAVRAQIDLDTSVLNKIDTLRDAERKDAMRDLEEWRSTAEEPILGDVHGKQQENRKAYRPPLKWFNDEMGEIKSREMTQQEIFRTESATKVKSITGEHLESNNSFLTDEKITAMQDEEKKDCRLATKDTIITSEGDTARGSSSCSEDSDSDYNDSATVLKPGTNPATRCLVKEMDERALNKFYKHKEEENHRGSGEELINRILNRKPVKSNRIFDEPKKSVPLPRKNGTIDVTFSGRVFPTPARESHHLEEQEWLEKQAEARRQTGFVAEDLRPEERDPQWLKDKGDEFFKAGNYLGAISAYSHGIKLSDKMSSLYANRSAAHYALGNFYRCAEDCTTALELIVPHCTGNVESRAKCHARRGAALCKISAPQHGIPELEAALRLAPDNETIKRDLRAAKQYFDIRE